MKIFFVANSFPGRNARQTGGTISNRNLLRALAEDHKVHLLSIDSHGNSPDFQDEPYTISVKAAPNWHALGLFLHWQNHVRQATQELISARGAPDLLIASTSTLAAFDAVPSQTKCLAVIQAFENFGLLCPWVPFQTRIRLTKGAILRRFEDTRLIRSADAIFTNSDFMRSAISKRFDINSAFIHVLPQQVDFEPLLSTPPKNEIGFVHRGPDKNIALVLELARCAPDLSFLIYGHSKGMPSAIPKNVAMMGWASDRSEMFASAGLWLVPSLWAEPFGRVSIEAQAAERPVLVANRGGLSETVFDHRYLIDELSADAWLRRIRQLMTMPREEIVLAGNTIRRYFSKQMHDKAVKEAIEMILGLEKDEI